MTNPGEHIPEQPLTPEEHEEEERYQQWMTDHPEPEPQIDRREHGPRVAEFERLVDQFEVMYSLEALHAITELEPFVEAPKHPLRQPAKIALEPIYALLCEIEEARDVSDDKCNELNAKYNRLSQAVGMIAARENNRVDHTRIRKGRAGT